MIPQIFHQVWVGGEPLPEQFSRYRDTWREHHPHWELRLWTDDDLPPDLRRPEAYDRERIPAERSDIIRLDLLWRFGGVYMDTDMECRKPLEPLLEGVEFFAAPLKRGGQANNAIFGSVPGHPLLDRALQELRVQEIGTPFDKTYSGRLFFGALVAQFPGATLLRHEDFHPSTAAERKQAYAIHHRARSWKDADGWRDAAIQAEERLDKERRRHRKTKRELERMKARLAEYEAATRD